MVAYSFKARFAPAIEDGSKEHTLRGRRRRHARTGEELQLYTGMRTAHCRLIMRRTCTDFLGVTIDFKQAAVMLYRVVEHLGDWVRAGAEYLPIQPEPFAVSDGFESFDDMARFWRDENGVAGAWDGFLIGWRRLPIGARL